MGGRGSSSGITNKFPMSNLPKLQGSEKQIEWANRIREETLNTASGNIRLYEKRIKEYGNGIELRTNLEAYKQVYENAYNSLMKQNQASKIIDKRTLFNSEVVNQEASRIANRIRNKK